MQNATQRNPETGQFVATPKGEETREHVIAVRLTEAEWNAIIQHVRASDKTQSQWVRDVLRQAIQ